MANCSIPNLNLVSGRISTKSSRPSRRRNNPAAVFHAVRAREGSRSNLPRRFNAQRSTPNAQRLVPKIGRWTLDCLLAKAFGVGRWTFSFSRRVKGAWWPSRSSKPSSSRKCRGRFDSYPLRLIFACHPERIPRTREKSKDPVAISNSGSSGFLDFARNDKLMKGGEPHVA
jgi:hypothetical protein